MVNYLRNTIGRYSDLNKINFNLALKTEVKCPDICRTESTNACNARPEMSLKDKRNCLNRSTGGSHAMEIN